MGVARVQFAESSNSGVTTITATLGSPTTAGNLLVVLLSVDGGSATPGVVTLTGSLDTFHQDANVTSTNPIASVNLSLYSDANCSGGHTQVVATSSASAGLLLMVWEISGAATTSPLAATAATAANPANTLQAAFDSTAGASVSAGCFWIGGLTGIGSGGRATPVLSGSWTTETQLQPGSATDMLGGYQAAPGSGTPRFNGTFSAPAAGAYWAAIAGAYSSASQSSSGTGTASLSLTATETATSTRSASRTTALALTATETATSARSGSRTAPLTFAATATVVPKKSGAPVAALALTAAETATSARTASVSAPLHLTATAVTSSARSGTGTARLSLTASAVSAAPPFTPGGGGRARGQGRGRGERSEPHLAPPPPLPTWTRTSPRDMELVRTVPWGYV